MRVKLMQNFETRLWRQPKQRVSREGKKEKIERRNPALDDAIWGLTGGGGGSTGGALCPMVVWWLMARSCIMGLLVASGGGGGESEIKL
ncbi:hypothetical protein NL676_035034 [Syzygium grande]|nr:hypothetical protein NL676_035034 [Syzygium grande]